jgi:hypothetical protein
MLTHQAMHFTVAFPAIPEPVSEVWQMLVDYLREHRSLPRSFEVSQGVGHAERFHSTTRLKLTPEEVGQLIIDRNLTGFHAHTSYSKPSVSYHLRFDQKDVMQSTLGCQIDAAVKSPASWARLVEGLMENWPSIGAWQWNHQYRVWQWLRWKDMYRESRYGSFPDGFKVTAVKSIDGVSPDRGSIDISLNPGRPKELIPSINFYPTAEMWLGPHFWQYAKCTKEEVLAADFFLEKRDTAHFLYLKSWHEPFTRPDGEQGRQQQRLWKLLFHEDCEWPPGSGGISDEPMYGPRELMPGYQPPRDVS